MKFKVGQKVRMVENMCDARIGDIGIIRALPGEYQSYAVEFPCFEGANKGHDCDGLVPSKNGYWIDEDQMEPFASFQEKLDRFMKEPVGFLVKSKEIADGLAKVFERNGMEPWSDRSTKEFMTVALNEAKDYPGDAYVCCNVEGHEGNLMCGTSDFTLECERELLDVTLDELKEYLESTPQTLEEKLELFKAGTHVLHTPTQEIYDKLIVELEKRGYTILSKSPNKFWGDNGEHTCIRYALTGQHYGAKQDYLEDGKGIIDLTPEDFNRTSNKQEAHMKITIETDGHYKTTAECNGITAESLCNPTDEFKLPKGVHMAVQRLLEKLKEPEGDTGFHVGDIVEVVANEWGFRGDPIGLQGVVKDVDAEGANINIPIPGSLMYFYNRELKLIRRGNN